MATIQFGGLATGIDTNALINGLIKVERRVSDVLQLQRVRLEAQQGILTTLSSKLASLKSAATALSLSVDFDKKAASSSDTAVLTVTADTSASAGTYDIIVDSLAKAGSVQSTSFTGLTESVGTGTLTISVAGTDTDVVVDATNGTLEGLRDAINNSGAAVRASIINVGSSTVDYRLIVQSKDTGTANAVAISGSLVGGKDPFPAGGTVVQQATDAVFSVNGLTVTRSSNTISDVISGVTLKLLKGGDADDLFEPTDPVSTVTVSSDSGAIKDSIKNFVDSYNDVNKLANDQLNLGAATQRQGALAGDTVLRSVINRIRASLASPGGIGTGFKYLSDIGIRFEKDGSLTVDDAKLADALATDPNGVSNLFLATQNGFGKRIPDIVDSFINAVDGALTFRQKGITSSINNIEKKISSEEVRLQALEKRLIDQFTALEKLVSDLNRQSQFLSQQLASLNSNK